MDNGRRKQETMVSEAWSSTLAVICYLLSTQHVPATTLFTYSHRQSVKEILESPLCKQGD